MTSKISNPTLTKSGASEGASEYGSSVADRLAHQADGVLGSAERMVDGTARGLHNRLDGLRESVPGAISRSAAHAEDMARRGIERARAVADSARDRAHDLGDTTVYRIREEPVKAVLIAAVVGAALTLLAQHMLRSREAR